MITNVLEINQDPKYSQQIVSLLHIDAGDVTTVHVGVVEDGTDILKLVVFQVSPMDRLPMEDPRSDC